MQTTLSEKNVFHNSEVLRGSGGESHQIADNKKVPVLTTIYGHPVADNQNTLKQGELGCLLMEDSHFRQKLMGFDHERIPERVVHARGFGAHGFFETYESLSEITKADLFQRKGEKTPIFVRFSTALGSRGSRDLARDVRGFAVKFYTKEGNWDLVSNNIPVFFIQDPIKFPDVIHAGKPEPDSEFPTAQTAHDNFWDFISLTPESMHMIMWLMSDRAIPRSFRFMEGFGVHTFKLLNSAGKCTFVKFHWKPKMGLQSVLWNEAVKISGADPDFHRKDLWNSIKFGQFPEWELGMQLFDEDFARRFEFDVLDSTKLIPEELVPVRRVGRLVLNKTVENAFAETEQVAFCTQNIVPGIDFSEDPLLQGRNFSYQDTQLNRLRGANFTQLPINAPKCPLHTLLQDGTMAMSNPTTRANYEPNSWGGSQGGPRESPSKGFTTYPHLLNTNGARTASTNMKVRGRSPRFADHYSQARQFFISQTNQEQHHVINSLIFELSKVKEENIRLRMLSHLMNIHDNLAKEVADGLRLELPKPADALVATNRKLAPSFALSIVLNGPKSFEGRNIGVFVTDMFDANLFKGLSDAVSKEKAKMTVIAPSVGSIKGNDGSILLADETIEAAPSALFDAIVLMPGEDIGLLNTLRRKPAFRDFVNDAWAHLKFIGYSKSMMSILDKLLDKEDLDDGFFLLANDDGISQYMKGIRNLRLWTREDKLLVKKHI